MVAFASKNDSFCPVRQNAYKKILIVILPEMGLQKGFDKDQFSSKGKINSCSQRGTLAFILIGCPNIYPRAQLLLGHTILRKQKNFE